MAARKKSGGGKGSGKVAAVLWFFFVLIVIFSFYQIPANRVTTGLGDALVAKSQTMQTWVTDTISGIDIPDIKIFG